MNEVIHVGIHNKFGITTRWMEGSMMGTYMMMAMMKVDVSLSQALFSSCLDDDGVEILMVEAAGLCQLDVWI
jgi:hypothetical protein